MFFVQHRLNLGFDEYSEESAGEVLRPFIAQFLAVGAVREWRAREGQHPYSTELLDYVESIISEYESRVTKLSSVSECRIIDARVGLRIVSLTAMVLLSVIR